MKGGALAASPCSLAPGACIELNLGEPGTGEAVPGIPIGVNRDVPGDARPIIVSGAMGEVWDGTIPCAKDGRPAILPERSGNGSISGDADIPAALLPPVPTFAPMPEWVPAPAFTWALAAAAVAICCCVVAFAAGSAADSALGATCGRSGEAGARVLAF